MTELSFRNYFAQAYLMIIGTIQGAAFAFLSIRSFNYTLDEFGSLNGLLSQFADPSRLLTDHGGVVYMLAMVVVTIVVTIEYVMFLAHFRRNIRLWEIIPPFILGITQIWMSQSIGSPQDWWLAAMAFSLAGTYAYVSLSIRKLKKIKFHRLNEDNEQRIRSTRKLLAFRVLVTLVSFLYCLLLWGLAAEPSFDEGFISLGALFYAVTFGCIIFFSAATFTKRVLDREDQSDREAPWQLVDDAQIEHKHEDSPVMKLGPGTS